jgi:hypothetical protein
MTVDEWRALCAELLCFAEEAGSVAEHESMWPVCDADYTLLDRARGALDEPQPKELNRQEMKTFACKWWNGFGFVKDKATCKWVIDEIDPDHFVDFMYDVLANYSKKL